MSAEFGDPQQPERGLGRGGPLGAGRGYRRGQRDQLGRTGGDHRAVGVAAEVGIVAGDVGLPVAVEVQGVVGDTERRPARLDLGDRDESGAAVEVAPERVGRGLDRRAPVRELQVRPESEWVVDRLRRAIVAERGLGAADRHEQARVHADRFRIGHEHGPETGQRAELALQEPVDRRGGRPGGRQARAGDGGEYGRGRRGVQGEGCIAGLLGGLLGDELVQAALLDGQACNQDRLARLQTRLLDVQRGDRGRVGCDEQLVAHLGQRRRCGVDEVLGR